MRKPEKKCRGCGAPESQCREKWSDRADRGRTRVPASREVLEEEVRRMVERHVAEATLAEARAEAAYHEAGHAVIARLLGLRVVRVTIDAGHGATEIVADGRSTMERAVAVLAGDRSERMWFPGGHGGADGDEAALRRLYAQERFDARRVAAAADAMLAEYADAVEAFAVALVERGSRTGDQLDEVLRATVILEHGEGEEYPAGMTQDSLGPVIRRWQSIIARIIAEGADPQGSVMPLAQQQSDMLGLTLVNGRSRGSTTLSTRRPESRFNAGQIGVRTTVGNIGERSQVLGEVRTPSRHNPVVSIVTYDPDQPPPGRTRQWVEAWNAAQRAGDAGDWPLFRSLQDRLAAA